MVDRFERFSFAISEISRYWHKIASDELKPYGLKGPYAVYFTALYRFPEGLTASRLGELCSRDKSDVSRAVTLLEGKGLIVKGSESGNLYRAKIRLTESGRAIAEHINRRAKLAVDLAGSGLTDADREAMYRSLEIIVSNLQKLSKDGLPA